MLGKKVTIIGGSGGLGRVFARIFKNNGFNVLLMARNEDRLKRVAQELGVNYQLDLKTSVKDADIVMISIPIKSTPKMIKNVASYLKEDAILFDVASLKSLACKELETACKKYPINCISLHPMFGPGIKQFKNHVIILLRIGGTVHFNLKVNGLMDLLKKEGFIITETTPEIHDKKIALTLGIPHMLNILFLYLLRKTSNSLSELTNYTGTTFLLQKVFAESIIQREMEMFGDIQMENPQFLEVLDLFEKVVKEYKKIIHGRDSEGFKRIFIEGLNYSKEDKHFEKSYDYFYQFIKILKE
ncbi:MAG: prephenate dehydrogenase/arogenate dehydrogenase family protein [Promethearchaeota archaeon]